MRTTGPLLALIAVPMLATASPAVAAPPRPSTTTLAPGVTLVHSSFHMRAGNKTLTEQVQTVTVRLSKHNSFVATTPGHVIGANRATVLAMARQEHAIAGIDGDVFYLSDPRSAPRGGLSYRGHVLKSALVGQKAVLSIDSSNVARIGDPGFAGSVNTTDHRYGFKIRSQNSLENAKNGAVSLVDNAVLNSTLPSCAVATLATAASGQWRITHFDNAVTHFTRVARRQRALVSCGGLARGWMKQHLVANHTVTVWAGYARKNIQTLISGKRVLIAGGRRFDDKQGLWEDDALLKPRAFACVMKNNHQVKIGAVEYGRHDMDGMTSAQLTSWLLGRGCYSAMTLDGSHSTQLVAKKPGAELALVNQQTNPGGPRQVVDGLFVVHS